MYVALFGSSVLRARVCVA